MYFALLARRRMDLYGATLEDFAAVKVKNAKHGLDNPNARYRKETSVEDVLASPVVSDPLRLLDICATSDGAAALIVASAEFAKKHLGSLEGVPSVRAVSTVTPRYPQHLPELPDIATDSTAVVPAPDRVFKDQILDAAYAEAGIGPEDLSLAEVYDLSTALELDWYEHLGLCPKGEAEQLLRSGATTHRRPHPGQPVRRAGVLRRGDTRPGHRSGLRADLAAEGPGDGPPGRGRHRRRHRQPGPVRPRFVGHCCSLGSSLPMARRTGPPSRCSSIGAVLLVWVGRRQTERQARRLGRILGAVTAVIYAAILIYIVTPPSIEYSVPLQLTDLATVVAAYALWSQKQWAYALTYYWGLVLSTQALISPALQGPDFPHYQFLAFWAIHLLVVWAAIYLTWGRGMRPDWRSFRLTVVVTLVWATVTFTFNSDRRNQLRLPQPETLHRVSAGCVGPVAVVHRHRGHAGIHRLGADDVAVGADAVVTLGVIVDRMAIPDDWAPDACTLPTEERPLRVAEFDDLFAFVVRAERREPHDSTSCCGASSRHPRAIWPGGKASAARSSRSSSNRSATKS